MLLSFVACTTAVQQNVQKNQYHWKILVQVDNKIDTAYLNDHMVDLYLPELHSGDSIDVSVTNIGYVYTSDALVKVKISKFLNQEYDRDLSQLPEVKARFIKISSQIPGYPRKAGDPLIPKPLEDPTLVPR